MTTSLIADTSPPIAADERAALDEFFPPFDFDSLSEQDQATQLTALRRHPDRDWLIEEARRIQAGEVELVEWVDHKCDLASCQDCNPHDCETPICWCELPPCWVDGVTDAERVWLDCWVPGFEDMDEQEQGMEVERLRAEPWHEQAAQRWPDRPDMWPSPLSAPVRPRAPETAPVTTGSASQGPTGMSVGIQPVPVPGKQLVGVGIPGEIVQPPTVRDKYPPTAWGDLLDVELPPLEQWPGSLLAPGEQASLYGPGKVGKSLIALDMAYRIAAGLPWLGDPARRPARVLYLDKENGLRVFIGRMRSLGFRPCGNLVYLSFPHLPALDTPQGGRELWEVVNEYRPELVVFDTISRFISGKENDADTWLALYNNSLMPLKGAGIASLRLDHTGKDSERGTRGSSAKSQDVDHVWAISEVAGQLLLERTDTRTGDGISRRWIERKADRGPAGWSNTRHLTSDGPDAKPSGSGWLIQEKIIEWIAENLGTDTGNPKVLARKAELVEHLRGVSGSADLKISNAVIRTAIETMKARVARGEPATLPQVPALPE
ncbi:AAA family ATPase [Micromonospora sp. NPDC000442]|uniref:AAA family ATPase n=1 Tax=Micromonospora sp. NPDC000442 TaxID=3364217 RepID=UPI00368A0711